MSALRGAHEFWYWVLFVLLLDVAAIIVDAVLGLGIMSALVGFGRVPALAGGVGSPPA